MKKISIVIVTYNSSKHIYDCLDSIFKYNDIDDGLEIIVVDNHSDERDTMFAGIRKLYGQRVFLADSGRNGGYGAGNNYGINITTSPIVIVMNPDVRLIQPIFGEILKKMENNSVGMLGVSFIDGSSPFYYKPGYISFFRELFINQVKKYIDYNPNKMFMSGSFFAFRKEAFVMAGSFDENIFMYYEEADITNRILKAGYQVEWHPELIVLHFAHGRKFNKILDDIKNSSFEYYCNKYGINIIKEYKIKVHILMIKKAIAWIIRDVNRYEVFSKTIDGIRRRIKIYHI